MKKLALIAGSLLLVTNSFAGLSQSYEDYRENTKYEDYLAELARQKADLEEKNKTIAELEAKLAGIQAEIAKVKGEADQLWQDQLDALGITQADFDAYKQSLQDFISKVNGFESTYADQFAEWGAAIKAARTELAELLKNKIAMIPRLDGLRADAHAAIDASANALQAAKDAKSSEGAVSGGEGSYTVQLIPHRRDCLWRIAEKDEIYGDALKWPSIYSANKDQIKDPDLIYPGQTFEIPR